MKIDLADQVQWMAFGNRGTRIAIHDNNGVKVCEYPQLNTIFALTDRHGLSCAFSPDGRTLACGTYLWSEGFIGKVERHLIEIWDVEKNEVIERVELPHKREAPTSYCLVFSPDSAWLAVVREDGLVVATHVRTRKSTYLEQPRERFFQSMPSCIFFREMCILAYTYLDEAIKLVELDSMRRIHTLKVNNVFQLFGYRRSDAKMLVAKHGKDDYDNQFATMDIDSGNVVPLIEGRRGYLWSPVYPTLSPSGKYIAAVVLKETPTLLFSKPIHSVDIWDTHTGRLVSETITDKMTDKGLLQSVFSLAFASDRNLLVGKRGSIEEIVL
ncbi:MAG: WD40 repeat domain-containing protein [Anaerolineae bacterium]|nr:WD40 repeat domain-containing protein [Anaerolineae bacterium]